MSDFLVNNISTIHAIVAFPVISGEVTFVEFMAPSGDVAYATFKGKKERSRIGEGYPINKKGSWSSPDYVIRSVSNFGVPYKFTVPALAKFSTR